VYSGRKKGRGVMANELEAALDALLATREAKRTELANVEEAIEQMRKMILVVPTSMVSPESGEYRGVPLSEAAFRWLKAVGGPRSTRDIADAIRAKGVETRSKNYIATVYASLIQNKRFVRLDDGNWWLRDRPYTTR
jgi:hypothetical protein